MYERRGYHPMYDYGAEPPYASPTATTTTHVTHHNDPVVVLRRHRATPRPFLRLAFLGGAGALAGKFLLGGPVAIVGGLLVGGLVDEAWSRLTAKD